MVLLVDFVACLAADMGNGVVVGGGADVRLRWDRDNPCAPKV